MAPKAKNAGDLKKASRKEPSAAVKMACGTGDAAERELVGVARASAGVLVLGEVTGLEDVLRAARGRRVEGSEDAASARGCCA